MIKKELTDTEKFKYSSIIRKENEFSLVNYGNIKHEYEPLTDASVIVLDNSDEETIIFTGKDKNDHYEILILKSNGSFYEHSNIRLDYKPEIIVTDEKNGKFLYGTRDKASTFRIYDTKYREDFLPTFAIEKDLIKKGEYTTTYMIEFRYDRLTSTTLKGIVNKDGTVASEVYDIEADAFRSTRDLDILQKEVFEDLERKSKHTERAFGNVLKLTNPVTDFRKR